MEFGRYNGKLLALQITRVFLFILAMVLTLVLVGCLSSTTNNCQLFLANGTTTRSTFPNRPITPMESPPVTSNSGLGYCASSIAGLALSFIYLLVLTIIAIIKLIIGLIESKTSILADIVLLTVSVICVNIPMLLITIGWIYTCSGNKCKDFDSFSALTAAVIFAILCSFIVGCSCSVTICAAKLSRKGNTNHYTFDGNDETVPINR